MEQRIIDLENEVTELRDLLDDVINTLDNRDDFVKEWIIERLNGINLIGY